MILLLMIISCSNCIVEKNKINEDIKNKPYINHIVKNQWIYFAVLSLLFTVFCFISLKNYLSGINKDFWDKETLSKTIIIIAICVLYVIINILFLSLNSHFFVRIFVAISLILSGFVITIFFYASYLKEFNCDSLWIIAFIKLIFITIIFVDKEKKYQKIKNKKLV